MLSAPMLVAPGAGTARRRVAGRSARMVTDYDHDELVVRGHAAERCGEDVISCIGRISPEAARVTTTDVAAPSRSSAVSACGVAVEYAALAARQAERPQPL